jgi:hypothetical protein
MTALPKPLPLAQWPDSARTPRADASGTLSVPEHRRIALGRFLAWLSDRGLALDTTDEPIVRAYLDALQAGAHARSYVYISLCHLIAALERVHPQTDWRWLRAWRRQWRRAVLTPAPAETSHRKLAFAPVPFAWWPQDLQERWRANAPAHWAAFQHRYYQDAYGRFRAFCAQESRPVEPTRATLEAYAEHVAARLAVAAPQYLHALRVALTVLWPGNDVAWLVARARRLRPARKPRPHAPPRRTLSVAFADWPRRDQERWTQAVTPPAAAPGHLMRLRGRRAQLDGRAVHGDARPTRRAKPPYLWSKATLRSAAYAYGAYLHATGPRSGSAITVTPDGIARWVGRMLARMTRFSAGNRVRFLASVMRVLHPDHDWRWLADDAALLLEDAPAKRNKLAIIADVAEIRRAAVARMRRAQRRLNGPAPALEFQDGLIMLLLSYRPLRRRNLAEARLGVHIQAGADVHTGRLVFKDSKSGEPYEAPLPARLGPWFKIFLDTYRPILAGPAVTDEAWGSLWGTPLSGAQIYRRIARATEQELGKRLPLHLFRDCLATTVSVIAPEHIEDAARVLGHRAPAGGPRRAGTRLAAIETYRQLSGSAVAARALAVIQAPAFRPARRRPRASTL